MKRLLGRVVCGAGVLAVIVGLVFLGDAEGQLRSFAIAAGGLFGGVASVSFGLKLMRAARAEDPEVLRAKILVLAREGEGVLPRSEIVAHLGALGTKIDVALEALLVAGTCCRSSEPPEADPDFVFPAFLRDDEEHVA